MELERGQRTAYLQQISSSNPGLFHELESLLASRDSAETSFMNTVPAGRHTQWQFENPQAPGPAIYRRVGPYQIFREIGAGGMGEVYKAVRADEYHKEVAIKLVRAGYDSDFVVARFRAERQILASLAHPNIAALLDGGTTDEGIPYFVMELVDGQPLPDYCDSRHLSVSDRLRLFLQVCSAVQHAHQRLIIHRDIKPGNILVTADGVPKLLDFGIAKILETDGGAATSDTMSMFRMLTPAYASPEQVRGEPITTASDVYSLGVVLYELLTGRSPYPTTTSGSHELGKAVCEWEPERPSVFVRRGFESNRLTAGNTEQAAALDRPPEGSAEKLSRRLRGDLDTIVLTALRKEPQRRYSSAEQLATDIRRHLESLPITARQDSITYLASKFIARHKVGVAAVVGIASALLIGLGLTLREAHNAREQQLRAERRFSELRVLANSLMFDIHDAVRDLPGATPVRKLLVQDALHYLDSLAEEKTDEPSLKRELAAGYARIGDVQGNPNNANLGDTAGALASYRKALAIRDSLAASGVNSPKDQHDLGTAYENVGLMEEAVGDPKAALENCEKALAIVKSISADASSPESQEQLAGIYWVIGYIKADLGDLDSALENYQISAATREAVVSAYPGRYARTEVRLAGTYGYMSGVLFERHDYHKAIRLQRQAEAILKNLLDVSPTNATYQEYYYESIGQVGIYLRQIGDIKQAEFNLRRALIGFEAMRELDPSDVRLKQRIGLYQHYLGLTLTDKGDAAASLGVVQKSALQVSKLSPEHLNEKEP